MTTLELLKNASRPYKPFQVTVEGEEFNLFARKASFADTQSFQDVWDKTYAEVIGKTDEAAVDTTALYANLKRQPVERLAKFVARAERSDFLSDAATILDKPVTDPAVTAKADEAVAQREQELSKAPHEEVLEKALERRAHFFAINQANDALNKAMASSIIYSAENERLFPTLADVNELPIATIEALTAAAVVALTPPAPADEQPPEEPAPLAEAASQ